MQTLCRGPSPVSCSRTWLILPARARDLPQALLDTCPILHSLIFPGFPFLPPPEALLKPLSLCERARKSPSEIDAVATAGMVVATGKPREKENGHFSLADGKWGWSKLSPVATQGLDLSQNQAPKLNSCHASLGGTGGWTTTSHH